MCLSVRLLPMETVDLKPYNEKLKSLCADNAVEFVENYDSFLLANGQLVDSIYLKSSYISIQLVRGSC